jgi:hypothetical protein
MSKFTLKNKLTAKACFELGPTPLIDAIPGGILPMQAVLEEGIGTETVLLLVEKTPFIHELARLRPFNLYLKTGAVRTSHGPLIFLLFYVPNPSEPQTPFMMVDCHLDPFNPSVLAVWRDLARQTHWHLVLVDGKGEVYDLFEFENVYGLGEALHQLVTACKGMAHGNFSAAKEEFCRDYDLEGLYNE